MAESGSCDDSVVHQLTTEQKIYAAAVLKETEKDREIAIADIKQWIQSYPESENLCARTDDFFILRFLRTCKFDIEKTKLKMLNYYKQRGALPEWYANRDPFLPELQNLLDLGIMLPLRKLDHQGRMIIFVRATQHNPRVVKFSDVLKVSMMTLDLATRDHVEASLYGCVAFIDLDGVRMGHAMQLRPDIIRNIVHSWQGCYPLRIRSINFINAPEYINVVLRIFKHFMNQKLKERLNVYTGEMTYSCSDDIPTSILPVQYGGTDGTIEELKEDWKKVVEENRDWLIDDEKYKQVS